MTGMTPDPGTPSATPAAEDVAGVERALSRVSYLSARVRRHDRAAAAAGVPPDRAAVVVLRQLADAGAMRPGELAARLEVEAPHVTRQVHQLAKAGYADRGPDPGDRRAHLIQLTPAGRAAARRIRQVRTRSMRAALPRWSPQDLHQLATLLHRMSDDLLASPPAGEEGDGELPG